MAHSNRGLVHKELGRYEAALADYNRAIDLSPDCAEAHSNRGIVLQELNQPEAAVASYDRAIAISPDYAQAYLNRSLALLLQGELERGWTDYEWRVKTKDGRSERRDFLQPRWLGAESLVGKTVLLHCEQGFGDTLQFCRYAKLVADMGAKVLLQVPRALKDLLGTLDGVGQLLLPNEPLPDFDFHSSLMSLPWAFKTTLATIPNQVPYLRASERKRRIWRQRIGDSDKLQIGLVWSGGFRPNQPSVWAVNNRRNIPLTKLATILRSDCTFYSLQKGQPAESELADWIANGNEPQIVDLTASLHDFSDTAALIAELDLVISVDTSVVHLAGALGKPVWLLNRFDTCWRWLLERTDSPWYPTITLYRQERMGDWDSVLQRVRSDLEKIVLWNSPERELG